MTDRRYWFDCLHDGCTARYRYYSHLLHHYTLGKHKMKLEKHSLVDKCKILFHENLTTNHFRTTPLLSITVVPPTTTTTITIPPLSPSWATQKSKSIVRFNEKQRKFLEEKFNQGVHTGRKYGFMYYTNIKLYKYFIVKWDPAKVSVEMEMAATNGNFVFESDECLSVSQIKSYFSRLATKQRSTKESTTMKSSTIEKVDIDDSQTSNESTDNESTDDDDVDERDLDSYTCRQTFNDARAVLDRSSNLAAKSTTSTIPSATTVSTKRKSTTNQSNANKHRSQ